jgi:hypothetical protein
MKELLHESDYTESESILTVAPEVELKSREHQP